MSLTILSSNLPFPDVSCALSEPNGLLAIGGDLSISRLIEAYQHGIFPWYTENQPILWWSPEPRAVIFCDELKISRSLRKIIKNKPFKVTFDKAFDEVIKHCAAPRRTQAETWITPDMQSAYSQLHEAGFAHSVEVWQEEKLIGGLYGVDCGRIFTGESMFSTEPNGSKIALVYLVKHLERNGYYLVDCQINNPFLHQFGTKEIPREDFIKLLEKGQREPKTEAWLDNSLPLKIFD